MFTRNRSTSPHCTIKILWIVTVLVLQFQIARPQDSRTYLIQRIQNKPVIDGELQDVVWASVPVSEGFTQTIPEPDKPSRYKSEVQMAYTNQAIYVAAKLYQPESIHALQLTSRDGLSRINADQFSVFLDTYQDKQNGYVFRVSSQGVQQEERLIEGDEYGDIAWDAVWASATRVSSDYWTVELEIPFSALRFSSAEQQQWGVNFGRLVRKKNESSFWNPINPQKQGFLAQAGNLTGLKDIKPPVRLFFFPYLSTGYFQQPEYGSTTQRWLRSGGCDIKYGINDAFTLDLTLIPDFSQVISDNVIRNLSPFEQQLTENRPFFTEGTELFNKLGMFYSRRIGSTPEKYYQARSEFGDTSKYNIEKNPNITSLYNAIKISGRNKKKLGIGIFNAVGAPSYAQILDKTTGSKFRYQTEGLNNFNVIVLDQTLTGQSFVNLTNTNVYRQLNRSMANVTGLKWNQFFRNESMLFSLLGRFSQQQITSEQWNRGLSIGVEQSKISGNFRYTLGGNYLAPQFDQSDMGLQFDYNNSIQIIQASWRENKPKLKFIQTYEIGTTQQIHWNARPYKFKFYQAEIYYFILFKSFWDLTFSMESKPISPIDYYQFRSFDKQLKLFPYLYGSVSGSSDSRKKLFWSFYLGYGGSGRPHTGYIYTEQGLRYRLGNRAEASISMWYKNDQSNLGYATFDAQLNEPIAGRRDVNETSGELSFKYNVSPLINLTGRFRHYHSNIRYLSLHRLTSGGEWESNEYPLQTNLNENYNLQNIDIFFNWMFRPGSRLVLSYKQWLNNAYILNEYGNASYTRNVYEVIKKPKAFELNARVIFFLDYNQFRKKGLKN